MPLATLHVSLIRHFPARQAVRLGRGAQTDAKTLAMHGSLDNSDPLLLSNWSTAGSITIAVSCYDNSGGTYRGLEDLAIITVSTSFNFDDIGLLSTLGITGLTINASHQEMFIGG